MLRDDGDDSGTELASDDGSPRSRGKAQAEEKAKAGGDHEPQTCTGSQVPGLVPGRILVSPMELGPSALAWDATRAYGLHLRRQQQHDWKEQEQEKQWQQRLTGAGLPQLLPAATGEICVACSQCSRAKVSCVNGQRPCARCVRLGTQCDEDARALKRACIHCRRTRVKCDRDVHDPCTLCTRLHLQCIPYERMPMGRKRKVQG